MGGRPRPRLVTVASDFLADLGLGTALTPIRQMVSFLSENVEEAQLSRITTYPWRFPLITALPLLPTRRGLYVAELVALPGVGAVKPLGPPRLGTVGGVSKRGGMALLVVVDMYAIFWYT